MKEKSKSPAMSQLGHGDNRRCTSGSRDVNLTIFITSGSCSKGLTYFTNRFFRFSGPPGLRLAFDAAKKNEKFGRIQSHRSKESSSKGKRRKPVFLCRRTVKVEVKAKAIPTSFLKIEGRGKFVAAKD